MPWSEHTVSIILAVAFGGLIGLERQLRGKAAGLRTNILICLGAAAFTIISKEMAGTTDSVTRIAAQVASGVGFLGAGAIIQDRGGIHGLTTAATIWLVASIGTVCGAADYKLALLVTIIAVIVLAGLSPLESFIDKRFRKFKSFAPSDNPSKNQDNEI